MEKYKLERDVKIMCLPVPAFPNGIQEAFNELWQKLPRINNRNFYGISYMNEASEIIYKSAAEEMKDGEAEKYGYEPFTIIKGEYLTETINNWRNQLPSIGETFMEMVKDPRMDRAFPCVEWYKTDEEMWCMIRMADHK